MPAAAGLLLAALALGERDGFLYRFAQSLTAKVTGKTRTARDDRAWSLLSGAALGSAAAIPLSFIPFAWTPLILGGVCVLAGIVLAIVGGSKAKSHMEGVAA